MKVILSLLAGCLLLASLSYGQTTPPITEEEKAAAHRLAREFETRFDDEGSIAPVAKEMFAADYMKRWMDVGRKDLKPVYGVTLDRVVLIPGIEYNPKLLDEATEDDWRTFYFASFDIFQYPINKMLNRAVEAQIRSKDPKAAPEMSEKMTMVNLLPKNVVSLFEQNPILEDIVRENGAGKTLNTVSELKNVTATLQKALSMLPKDHRKLSPDARKFVDNLIETDEKGYFTPSLVLSDNDFGVPSGGRIIGIYSSSLHRLLISKIGNDYKIINAWISPPD